MNRSGPAMISGADVLDLVRPVEAVAALTAALRAGVDPADDPDRTIVEVRRGQLLLMPGEVGEYVGIKVISSAPGNGGSAWPRIQGFFMLLDAERLEPVAFIDGIALTTIRTPAVSIAAVQAVLLRDPHPLRMVVVGAGPQAVAHVRTAVDVLAGAREIESVTYLVRRTLSIPPAGFGVSTATAVLGSVEAAAALRQADLVVCATSSATPILASSDLRDGVVVVAVGSHEPDQRELDGPLMARAQVIVEDRRTALREAGDVVMAAAEGLVDADGLILMRDVVTGDHELAADRPVVFKSTGMAWEDLVVAGLLEHKRQGRDAATARPVEVTA